MTENEIIEILDDIWTFGHEPTDKERLAANKAIDLIQEIQQYRAIGTVEECRLYKGISEKDFSTACIDLKIIDELREYKNIGTVEECREAREKQRAKIPNGRYKTRYMWDSSYCPACGCGITARWNFCQSCGQAIDWSDTP